MKTKFPAIVSLTIAFLLLSFSAAASDHMHRIDLKKLKFSWTIDGNVIHIQLVGKTKGWVAVGFNATSQMKDANIIIGYVKKGKVKISDDFGVTRTKHKPDKKLSGKSNLKAVSGNEKQGITTLNFTIPLNSGDKNDGVIQPDGNTRVILATGTRDSFRFGHNFHATLDVNLETGRYQRK